MGWNMFYPFRDLNSELFVAGELINETAGAVMGQL
jgi:hypothetical protein